MIYNNVVQPDSRFAGIMHQRLPPGRKEWPECLRSGGFGPDVELLMYVA